MDSNSESEKEIITVDGMDVTARFKWSVGKLMDRFYSELSNKIILGAECPKCGFTLTPPRSRCAECYSEIDEGDLVELPEEGTLTSYTITQRKLDGKGHFQELEESQVIGAVQLEGADSTLFMPIDGVDLDNLEVGLKVKVVWREDTKGEIGDMKYFKPINEVD